METIRAFVAAELGQPVDPRVAETAAALAARYPDAARAVLFYGSCLRQSELDGLMLDFYLIVASYEAAYSSPWLRAANRLIPPNVFPFHHDGLAAKYAVLSEEDFARECGPVARSVSVWARFAQPSRLVWANDNEARERAVDAVSRAAPTLFELTRPALAEGERDDPLAVFRAGFAFTYGAELRAERRERADSVVDSDPERYRRFGEAVLRSDPVSPAEPAARRRWRRRQAAGKLLTAARLVKASATFAGGADYLVWKINRHAGTDIVLKPWQRRWPLLAAVILLPRLLRRGAVR